MIFVYMFIAVALTCTMFVTKNSMLGYPSAMFWAIFGAYSYTLSTIPWGDTYYFLFFGAMGMAIFSVLATFALNKRDLEPEKKDLADSIKYVDEEGRTEPDTGEDTESRPSARARELHRRASLRRTGTIRKKPDYGEFK